MNNNEQESQETVMTSVEVAKLLKVSPVAVRRWTRDGSLKGYRLGGTGDWRYFRKDVIAFLMGGKQEP